MRRAFSFGTVASCGCYNLHPPGSGPALSSLPLLQLTRARSSPSSSAKTYRRPTSLTCQPIPPYSQEDYPLQSPAAIQEYLAHAVPPATNFIYCWDLRGHDFFGQWEHHEGRVSKVFVDMFDGRSREVRGFPRSPPKVRQGHMHMHQYFYTRIHTHIHTMSHSLFLSPITPTCMPPSTTGIHFLQEPPANRPLPRLCGVRRACPRVPSAPSVPRHVRSAG